jgi:plastocyanin
MRTTIVLSAALLAALCGAADCAAATIEVSVVDEQGKPIADVAVYATAHDPWKSPKGDAAENGATGAAAAASGPVPLGSPRTGTAIMDQQDHEFVPHVLVVRTGTAVTFPNSDTVSHHVYSFSPTKPFELGLYKGNVYPPVVFDKPGIVVVGCNIHDSMLGYIRVVDTPHFAVTNEQGVALLDAMPNGDYVVEAWTPRVRPEALPAAQHVAVAAAAVAAEIRITGRLAPAHGHGGGSLTWDRY